MTLSRGRALGAKAGQRGLRGDGATALLPAAPGRACPLPPSPLVPVPLAGAPGLPGCIAARPAAAAALPGMLSCSCASPVTGSLLVGVRCLPLSPALSSGVRHVCANHEVFEQLFFCCRLVSGASSSWPQGRDAGASPGVETLLTGTAEPGEPLPRFSLIHELLSLELQAPAQWLFSVSTEIVK